MERQTCQWSGNRRGLVKLYPMLVRVPTQMLVFVPWVTSLLIVETQRSHQWLRGIGGVVSTGCPGSGSAQHWASRRRFWRGSRPSRRGTQRVEASAVSGGNLNVLLESHRGGMD